jgi:putative tricarboxylic transport membrane protein
MNPLDGLAFGFSVALDASNILAVFIGAMVGTFVGVLPGLGPAGALAMLLPITVGLRPETALIMLAGIYYGAMYGGSTTSILVNMPGETASVVTCIDGYQMALKGRAGPALTVAAVGSFLAGTIGTVGLMLFAPPLAQFALSFGPPEYFAIALLGLLALSRISGGSFWKGLFILALGLALATVGIDLISGMTRYCLGSVFLMQGIELVPVAMGLFGMAEVLLVAERAGGLPHVTAVRLRELVPNLSEWRRSVFPMLRGSIIGFLIGLLPGPSATISAFASYKVERRISKYSEEFGHGAIEGVAGPESANNASTCAHLIPMLSLGIPLGAVMALLMAALMMQGVQPGPLLIQEHPRIFWGVVASMYMGNVALLILNLPLVGMWVSFLRIPQPILMASILIFMLVGTYSVNNSVFDVIVLVAMGVIGYVLRKLKFDIPPLVVAVILGPILEKSFRQSLYMSRGSGLIFFQRPISAILLILTLVVLLAPLFSMLVRKWGRGRTHSSFP